MSDFLSPAINDVLKGDDMEKQPQSYTWTKKNLFDPKTVRTSSKPATKFDALRLALKPMRVSVDRDDQYCTFTYYKRLDDLIYVLRVDRQEVN